MNKRFAVLATISLLVGFASQSAEIRLVGLDESVDLYTDEHGIPHIYANSWPDAARVLGYVHASDRLWQMDLLRRQASGTLAEIMGESALKHDIHMRRLGIRRGCEELWASDSLPPAFVAELEAYAEGVNARMRFMTAERFGFPFTLLEYEPESWTPVDSLVFMKYMGWDQSGTDDDLWLGIMVEKFGAEAVEELWPIDRPYDSPQVRTPTRGQPSINANVSNAERAYAAAMDAMGDALSTRGSAFGSNNWAVAGEKTRSGKPMLCSDPHLGFTLPSVWYAVHLNVRGESIAGVTFPTAPHIVIGHNDAVGWGITNLQADAVDYFIESRHPFATDRYLHKGVWKTFETRTEQIAVKGIGEHTIVIESTVHGPVITSSPRTISLQWTGLGATTESVALWGMNRASHFEEWYQAAQQMTVPGINLAYADVHGTIALYSAGAFPKRSKGEGRIPMPGATGDHDWDEMIPTDEMPLALNPPEGFVASANARPVDGDYPHYLGWMWDAGYRHRRITELLKNANNVSINDMRTMQFDVYDLAAQHFLPTMLSELDEQDFAEFPYRRAINTLKNWDYRATTDSNAPAIWMRWLDHYRKLVWDAQWSSRSIEKRPGSWGFSGINRREPIIEVLEHMTRNQPDSPWFDSPETSWKETRHDIALGSFITAMGTLERQFGKNVTGWTWGNTNLLRIESLLQDPELRRIGDPVPGTMFTMNPGGDIGPVSDGASWRMIVDFAATDESIGIYPGGQSGHADSPHYDDFMSRWAQGEFVRLYAVDDSEKLPKAAQESVIAFTP